MFRQFIQSSTQKLPNALSMIHQSDKKTWGGILTASVATIAWMNQSKYNESSCDENKHKFDGYSWGSGQYGQLGHGEEKDVSTPQLIESSMNKSNWIAAGGDSSALILESGEVCTFGAGGNSRLGHGESLDTPNLSTPQQVEMLPNNVKKIDVGEYHMAGLTTDGQLFTWGKNRSPQLGHSNEQEGFPNKVSILQPIVDVACGRQQTVAVTKDGQIYSWGLGFEGALGHGDRIDQYKPKLIEALSKQKVESVSCGREFSLALTSHGKVYSWGANDYNQLGTGSSVRYQRTPVHIASLQDKDIVQVSAGCFHSAALSRSGVVYTWGNGKDGQLGSGTTHDVNLPRPVKALEGKKIVSISCGGGHTACVSEDGELWMFGRGRSGQLGRGAELESIAAYRVTPTKVKTPGNVVQVACGSDHTVALIESKN